KNKKTPPPPEFRNRLDNIIWFRHLSPEVIHQVVDKFIVELQAQLDAKGVSLEVSDEARDWPGGGKKHKEGGGGAARGGR
ncbi:MAG TPA: hypothetical protein DCM44_11485, partial [Pantoea sp.]|nr:hypothetical protein [Pantoea sp.]